MEQPTAEQLKETVDRYTQQEAMKQQQQAESEYKVWQLNIFRQRSEFWQRIFADNLDTWMTGLEPDEPAKRANQLDAAVLAATYADAALDQWDDRFLPKPPVPTDQQPQSEGVSSEQQPN